jgi:hypothetical protein
MDTPRPEHLRGADDVAPWVAGSQLAWDLMARRHVPFNAPRQDDDDGNPFALLRELLNRMPAQARAGDAPGTVAVNDATQAAAYVVDDAYRNGGFGAGARRSGVGRRDRGPAGDERRRGEGAGVRGVHAGFRGRGGQAQEAAVLSLLP